MAFCSSTQLLSLERDALNRFLRETTRSHSIEGVLSLTFNAPGVGKGRGVFGVKVDVDASMVVKYLLTKNNNNAFLKCRCDASQPASQPIRIYRFVVMYSYVTVNRVKLKTDIPRVRRFNSNKHSREDSFAHVTVSCCCFSQGSPTRSSVPFHTN